MSKMDEETNIEMQDSPSTTSEPVEQNLPSAEPLSSDPDVVSDTRKAIIEASKEATQDSGAKLHKTVNKKKEPSSRVKKPQPLAPESLSTEPVAPAPVLETEPDSPESDPDMPDIPEPQFWDAPDKEAFKKLPYEAKRLISKNEHRTRSWASQIAQQAAEARRDQKEYQEIEAPHRDMLQVYGIDGKKAYQNALANAALLERDPVGTISRYMRQFGLTPDDLMQGGPQYPQGNGYQANGNYYQPPYEEYVDPRVNEALEKVQTIEARFNETLKAQEASKQQLLIQEIETFKSETDETGNLLRPNFEKLKPLIAEEANRLEAEGVYQHPRDILRAAYKTVHQNVYGEAPKSRLTNGQFATSKQVKQEEGVKAKAAAGSLSGSTLGVSNASKQKNYVGLGSTRQAIDDARREAGTL